VTCNFKLFNEKDNLKQKILSPTEEKKLLAESAEHLRRIIITALNTGMRRNEIFNLKWENIDLKLKLIEVTKTKAGKNRTIPINDDLYSPQ
jgi:integrase